MDERFSNQMVSLEADRDQIEDPLDGAHGAARTGHMLQQQESSTWTENAAYFTDRLQVVRDGAERKRADDSIEATRWKLERLCIPGPKIRLPAERLRRSLCNSKHGFAEIDCRQPDVRGVVLEVPTRSDGDFQDVSGRL